MCRESMQVEGGDWEREKETMDAGLAYRWKRRGATEYGSLAERGRYREDVREKSESEQGR